MSYSTVFQESEEGDLFAIVLEDVLVQPGSDFAAPFLIARVTDIDGRRRKLEREKSNIATDEFDLQSRVAFWVITEDGEIRAASNEYYPDMTHPLSVADAAAVEVTEDVAADIAEAERSISRLTESEQRDSDIYTKEYSGHPPGDPDVVIPAPATLIEETEKAYWRGTWDYLRNLARAENP